MTIINKRIEKANAYTPIKVSRDGVYTWSRPRIYWGPPGIGKTAGAEDLAYYLGFESYHVLSVSTMRVDEGGIPFPTESGLGYEIRPPQWAIRLNEAKSALLFIDEIGDGNPEKQSIIQQLTHERRLGDYKLGGHIRIMGAGNPVDCSTQGYDYAPAPANRAGHIDVQIGYEEAMAWCEWQMTNGGFAHDTDQIDNVAEEKRVIKAWPGVYAKWSAVIVNFVKSTLAGGTDLSRLLDLPKPGDPTRHRAWTSFRTTTAAAIAAAGAEIHDLTDEETEEFIASYVGRTWAVEFMSWLDNADLGNPEAILLGTEKFEYDESRQDRAYITIDACAARLVSMTKNEEYPDEKIEEIARNFWKLLQPITEANCDLCGSAVKMLLKAKLMRGCIDEARPVIQSLLPMLRAAGLAQV